MDGRSGGMPSLSASVSDPAAFGVPDARPAPAIIIRRLSRNIGSESLNSMLIFAGDLIDTEFIRSPYPEDHGFATAVARFRSQTSALEAQQKLHGKPNTSKDANMIVEVHSSSMASAFDRRNTIDASSRAQTSSTVSSNGSISGPRSSWPSSRLASRSPHELNYNPTLCTPRTQARSKLHKDRRQLIPRCRCLSTFIVGTNPFCLQPLGTEPPHIHHGSPASPRLPRPRGPRRNHRRPVQGRRK